MWQCSDRYLLVGGAAGDVVGVAVVVLRSLARGLRQGCCQ